MTHPLTLPALGLLISMTALPALAETAPKPGSHDARVTYATYQEGQVYRIALSTAKAPASFCPMSYWPSPPMVAMAVPRFWRIFPMRGHSVKL